MLYVNLPSPAKFILGFIYSKEDIYQDAKKVLEKRIGRADFESPKINFDFTDYYYPEMGRPLFRRFISFTRLKNPQNLVKIKLFCIKVERKYALDDKRRINIDPGYLTEAKLILATTKDFSHRIYLAKGIYAEVTLCFKEGRFCDLATTFPDYRTTQYKEIFTVIRNIYRENIKK
jgi:hypothetical protein